MCKHLFREVKRIASQFFETEHWYRWRKFGDRRAVSVLNDTWNGNSALLNWQIMKVEHMMHNLHKYGNESPLYISSFDVLRLGDHLTNDYIIDKIARHCMANPGERKYIDDNYFVSFESKQSSWTLWRRELDHTIPYQKIPKKDRLYKVEFGQSFTFDTVPIDKNVYRFVEEDSWEHLSEAAAYLQAKNINFYEKLIENEQSIYLELKDLNRIHPALKEAIRGNIPKYRQLWQYRKLIRKLQTEFDWDEPWHSKVDATLEIEDGEAKRAELEKIWQEFKDWRMSVLIEIAELWNKYSDSWWD